jgi:hypothetical protein
MTTASAAKIVPIILVMPTAMIVDAIAELTDIVQNCPI